MAREYELALCNTIEAWYVQGLHIVRAEGELPTPCYSVDIERSVLTVEPPEFTVKASATASFCPDVVTPFVHAEIFRIGDRRDEITVHHRDGTESIRVEEVEVDETASLPAFAPARDQATGYSKRVPHDGSWADAFGEALADAIANVPRPHPPPRPDALMDISVTNSGVLLGGFAGFRHMYVSVRSRTS